MFRRACYVLGTALAVTVRDKKRTETKKPNREPAVDVTRKEQGSKISWRTVCLNVKYVSKTNRGACLWSPRNNPFSHISAGPEQNGFFKFDIVLPFIGITVLYFIFSLKKSPLFPPELLPGPAFSRSQTLSLCSLRNPALDTACPWQTGPGSPGWGSVLGPWPMWV